MTYALFIDDERFPPRDGRTWEIARNFDEVATILERRGSPIYISFDHDLGDHTPSGFDIAKAMVEGDIAARMGEAPRGPALRFNFPKGFCYYIHSQNPVGEKNIDGYLEGYLQFLQR